MNLNTNATTNNNAPASQESRVLVTYFSIPETTNPNNMTTEEDNSVVVIDGEVLGNTQYMAYVIQEATGADIFRIEPRTPYPTNHSTLVDLAAEEQEQNARPAIKERVTNMDDYDVVFIGYPIWWSDMPQILYTFFDTYDFSGKTIIPFSTHGGSGFAGTPRTIQGLEPNATMLDGLTISRNNIQNARQEIIDWVNDLDI
nr:flavodoxin [Intestinimonas butyriciproducens]